MYAASNGKRHHEVQECNYNKRSEYTAVRTDGIKGKHQLCNTNDHDLRGGLDKVCKFVAEVRENILYCLRHNDHHH